MTVSAIECVALSKSFGAIRALGGLDLAVAPGEVVAYLGPNGAGKTTTIRLLLGLIRPTSGSANIFGIPCEEPAARANVGYLPAELRIEGRYTAGDVVSFHSALRGGVDRAHVAELVRRLEVEMGRPMRELSTGNRRKIGLLQAFMGRPRLLILDEPTGGLDPLVQREFRELVQEAVAGGAAVFLSSHVLSEVEVLADRVAVLRRGRLVAFDTVAKIRGQALQRVDFRFGVDAAVEAAEFRSLPGVTKVEAAGQRLRVTFAGPADALVKAAARHEVLAIESHELDLEEAVLRLYDEGGDEGGDEGEAP